jgi:exodeoxyribonuclease-5
MSLNAEQVILFDILIKFYQDPTKKIFIVLGAGGCGKTHAVVEFMNSHPELVKRMVLTAPTNAAVDVLRGMSAQFNRTPPDFQTIYSLLGLVLGNNGEVKRTFSAHDGSFDQYYSKVIDEGSMSGRDLSQKILERIEGSGSGKIIVMADPCQLNPINETHSELLTYGESFELFTDMRSGNGPLLTLKREIRDLARRRNAGDKSLTHKINIVTNLDEDGSGVHYLGGAEFTSAMLDMFDSDEYRADSNFVRVAAWENKEVDRLNWLIRRRIYGVGCDPYMIGERFALMSPVYDDETNECIFATDCEAVVQSINELVYTDYLDRESEDPKYKVYMISLSSDTATHSVPVIHPDSLAKFNRRAKHLWTLASSKKLPWKTYWEFYDKFIRIRPVHAMTVHKSQGRTFGCMFVNLANVMKNKNVVERARMGYVAMSRPRTDLVVNLKTFY